MAGCDDAVAAAPGSRYRRSTCRRPERRLALPKKHRSRFWHCQMHTPIAVRPDLQGSDIFDTGKSVGESEGSDSPGSALPARHGRVRCVKGNHACCQGRVANGGRNGALGVRTPFGGLSREVRISPDLIDQAEVQSDLITVLLTEAEESDQLATLARAEARDLDADVQELDTAAAVEAAANAASAARKEVLELDPTRIQQELKVRLAAVRAQLSGLRKSLSER